MALANLRVDHARTGRSATRPLRVVLRESEEGGEIICAHLSPTRR
jgi:hypothetical protein